MPIVLRGFVGAVALLEATAIAAFAAFALSGDAWGIARAMALLLAVPFVLLTAPALALVWRGRLRTGALLAAASVAVTLVAWALA